MRKVLNNPISKGSWVDLLPTSGNGHCVKGGWWKCAKLLVVNDGKNSLDWSSGAGKEARVQEVCVEMAHVVFSSQGSSCSNTHDLHRGIQELNCFYHADFKGWSNPVTFAWSKKSVFPF